MQVLEVPITEIVIGDRQRKDLGDIEGLQLSIEHYNLLQPILLQKRTDGRYDLIAGERRLRAFELLKRDTIPATLKGGLDVIQRAEIELEENLRRKQLIWVEEVQAEAKLGRDKKEFYDTNLKGRLGKSWTQKDTARELDISEAKLSQDLQLAAALEEHPQLKGFHTRREAIKQLNRIKAGTADVDVADNIRKVEESFVHKRFLVGMEDIESDSVDLIIADLTNNLQLPLLESMRDKLKNVGHAYVFFPMEKHSEFLEMLISLKVQVKRKPYIWHVKGEDSYQTFLWFSKFVAQPPQGVRELLSRKREKKYHLHELAKPYHLLHTIVEAATLKGAFVLNPIGYSISLVQVCLDTRRNVRVYCPNRALHEQCMLNLKKGG